jgi:hypothetical protein
MRRDDGRRRTAQLGLLLLELLAISVSFLRQGRSAADFARTVGTNEWSVLFLFLWTGRC